jgi:hypothetical protein
MENVAVAVALTDSSIFAACRTGLLCCLQLLASCPYRAGYPGISTG